MQRYVDLVFRYTENWEPKHWLLVLAGVVVVSLVCMRGFGSRSNY